MKNEKSIRANEHSIFYAVLPVLSGLFRNDTVFDRAAF
jgi:hypothetical protein